MSRMFKELFTETKLRLRPRHYYETFDKSIIEVIGRPQYSQVYGASLVQAVIIKSFNPKNTQRKLQYIEFGQVILTNEKSKDVKNLRVIREVTSKEFPELGL